MRKFTVILVGALLSVAMSANAQTTVKSKLKKILVLDKSQGGANGHMESRRDLNAALKALATEKGFEVVTIGQNDPASKITTEFSAANLATYQAVLFSNNDGVDAQVDNTSKANLEAYVKAGGGLIPIHAASAFIGNWSWLTSMLVQSFYSPHGNNQPKADVSHDAEGTKAGTETEGIFKGLTAPLAFLDEYYSFKASPRGTSNVTILLTVDEKTYTAPVNGPMGADHPVVWTRVDGKGHVLHNSMGHSWSTNNVYTAKTEYLKKFMYASLRYVAGDFVGCMNNKYNEYSADVTKSDSTACKTLVTPSIVRPDGKDMQSLITKEDGKQLVNVDIRSAGAHSVTMMDVSGHRVQSKQGVGPTSYSLPFPSKSGIYVVVAKSAGKETRFKVTVL